MNVAVIRFEIMNQTELMVAVGAFLGSKEVLGKLLGPTAEYFGGGLKDYTVIGVGNLKCLFRSAVDKLGTRIDQQGAVPPRVFRAVLENGYFVNDQLTLEYFGGVLASSRTSIARDDRGTSFCHLLESLSAYEIRAHYVLYSCFIEAMQNNDANIARVSVRNNLLMYLPQSYFDHLMDFSDSEDSEMLTSHAISGLIGSKLLAGSSWGNPSVIHKNHDISVDQPGIVTRMTTKGIELYYWAHGYGDKHIREFLDGSVDYPSAVGIEIDGSQLTSYDKNRE